MAPRSLSSGVATCVLSLITFRWIQHFYTEHCFKTSCFIFHGDRRSTLIDPKHFRTHFNCGLLTCFCSITIFEREIWVKLYFRVYHTVIGFNCHRTLICKFIPENMPHFTRSILWRVFEITTFRIQSFFCGLFQNINFVCNITLHFQYTQ